MYFFLLNGLYLDIYGTFLYLTAQAYKTYFKSKGYGVLVIITQIYSDGCSPREYVGMIIVLQRQMGWPWVFQCSQAHN